MATFDFIAPSALPATASISERSRQSSVSEHMTVYVTDGFYIVVEEANQNLPNQITMAELKAMGVKFRISKRTELPRGRSREEWEAARTKQPVAALCSFLAHAQNI
jgi:hypothetical protein